MPCRRNGLGLLVCVTSVSPRPYKFVDNVRGLPHLTSSTLKCAFSLFPPFTIICMYCLVINLLVNTSLNMPVIADFCHLCWFTYTTFMEKIFLCKIRSHISSSVKLTTIWKKTGWLRDSQHLEGIFFAGLFDMKFKPFLTN